MADKTLESYYQRCLDLVRESGPTPLGVMSNQMWVDDPRRLVFSLSRYKFVSKMLSGRQNVLEVGCADAFGTRVVLQEVKKLTAVDIDPAFVRDVQARMTPKWPFECKVHDVLSGPVPGGFDAAYALDVLEHIPAKDEDRFLSNIVKSLGPHGVLILGLPSSHSQVHASEASREGHVNCKDLPGLKATVERHFHNAFFFSMNDEVVHTGFSPMAHYLFAVCSTKK